MKALTLGSLTLAMALALAASIDAQQARDQTGAPPRTGTAAISGMIVTNEQTPQPIKRGIVTVTGADAPFNRTAFTDDAGRFSVTGLPPGRYMLTATKPPFLRAPYGAKRTDGAGTPITLKDGHQMTDIVLRMTRGAVLSGRITDENGEPAFGVSVRVLQARTQFGDRAFVPFAGSGSLIENTDDRGMFRIFGLPPGEYLVTASPRPTPGEVRAMTEAEIRAIMQALQEQQTARQTAQQQAQTYAQKPPVTGAPPPTGAPTPQTPDVEKVTVAYAPVYYPGTTSISTASTVTVAPGEERTGVDFPLRLVRTTTVEGMVVTPAGIPPQSVQLMMMPAGTAPANMAGIEMMAMQRVAIGPDGKFTYTAIAPGQYVISARASRSASGAPPPPPPPMPGAGQTATYTSRVVTAGGGAGEMTMVMPDMMMSGDADATQYWAMADVTVDGSPVSGVTLSLQPGMTLAGKIEFRSAMTRPGGDLRRTRLNLLPVATGGGFRINTSTPAFRVEDNGQFTITGVTPGRYRMTGNAPIAQGVGPGPAWFLASAVIKGRDVLDFPIDVGPGEDVTDAVVTFTDATQDVSGTLQDASGRPAPDYTIVVFAADNRYWVANGRRIRTARPGTDGKFSIANLPPGDYRIAAVIDVLPTEVNDPAFLEQLVGASVAFPLKLGEKKTQDLKIAGGL